MQALSKRCPKTFPVILKDLRDTVLPPQVQDTQEPRFRLDRPWLAGARKPNISFHSLRWRLLVSFGWREVKFGIWYQHSMLE